MNKLSLIIFLCLEVTLYNCTARFKDNPVAISVNKAHEQLWLKFIDQKNGILYDYASLTDTIGIPTPEECGMSMPNALSWWVPNENGAFFNGLYLDALCKRWKVKQDDKSEFEARKLVSGLKLLSGVSESKGFIARGLSTDNASHFPVSSPDQIFPWFYGLWHYIRSGIPDVAEKDSLITEMEKTALALASVDWKIPCERDDLKFFGDLAGSDYSDCARLLSVIRLMHELTGDDRWINDYYASLNEKPSRSQKTRLEILTDGLPYQEPDSYNSFWTSSMDQAALKELYTLEKDNVIRSQFRIGLDSNGLKAAKHIARYKEFDNNHDLEFNPDWRVLNSLWRPQKTMQEALELADLQLELWDRVSPAKGYELIKMMEPLNACWIVVLSGNPDIINPVMKDIRAALIHYDWARMNYSTFFIAECIYYEGRQYGL